MEGDVPRQDVWKQCTRELKSELSNQTFFGVGLSTPQHEKLMAAYLATLDAHLMIGVGVAFDIHTGKIIDAPRWIKAAGGVMAAPPYSGATGTVETISD